MRTYREKKRGSGEWLGYAPHSAVFFRSCSECGALFCARTSRAEVCGTDCRRFRGARLQRERYEADPQTERERVRRQRAEASLEQVLRTRSRNQARRAKMYGTAADKFTNLQVFERDEWTCQLCLERIDSTLRFPDPGSASLDHIQPLSLGGAHTFANSRASHLHCNCSRGNRIEAIEEVA